jgi:hypothetical protein
MPIEVMAFEQASLEQMPIEVMAFEQSAKEKCQ